MSIVSFHFETDRFQLLKRTFLKAYIKKIFENEVTRLQLVNIIFCSDDFLAKINKTYLRHDSFTDVITFDLGDGKKVIGEIYISIDRIRENSKIFNVSFSLELHRVIFHGILHLCGFKDDTLKNKREIRSKENYYLKNYFEIGVSRET